MTRQCFVFLRIPYAITYQSLQGPLNFVRSCNVIFKICTRVQLAEGREICRIRYVSRGKWGKYNAPLCENYKLLHDGWLDTTGRCSQPVWNALRSNLIFVITLHWTRAKFKKTICHKKSFKVDAYTRQTTTSPWLSYHRDENENSETTSFRHTILIALIHHEMHSFMDS